MLKDESSKGFVYVFIEWNKIINEFSYFQISNKNGMNEAKWLLFLDRSDTLDDYFDGVFIPINCEFLVVEWKGNYGFVIKEVYNVAPQVHYDVGQVGTWKADGLATWTEQSIFTRRKNLRKIVINAAVEPDVRIMSIFYCMF